MQDRNEIAAAFGLETNADISINPSGRIIEDGAGGGDTGYFRDMDTGEVMKDGFFGPIETGVAVTDNGEFTRDGRETGEYIDREDGSLRRRDFLGSTNIAPDRRFNPETQETETKQMFSYANKFDNQSIHNHTEGILRDATYPTDTEDASRGDFEPRNTTVSEFAYHANEDYGANSRPVGRASQKEQPILSTFTSILSGLIFSGVLSSLAVQLYRSLPSSGPKSLADLIWSLILTIVCALAVPAAMIVGFIAGYDISARIIEAASDKSRNR